MVILVYTSKSFYQVVIFNLCSKNQVYSFSFDKLPAHHLITERADVLTRDLMKEGRFYHCKLPQCSFQGPSSPKTAQRGRQ